LNRSEVNRVSDFYLNKLTSPASLAFLAIALVLADYILSLLLGLSFLVSPLETFAFSFRLLSICAAILALKYVWVKVTVFLNSYIDDEKAKSLMLIRLAKIVNDPVRHIVAMIAANLVYNAVVFGYVLPILRWNLAHLVVNSLWAGIIGIGVYVAASGIIFLHDILPYLKEAISIRVDPYHPDGYGGLREFSVLVIKFFLLTVLLLGLLVASVPYAVNFTLLSAILLAGNVFASTLLSYSIYMFHEILSDFKHKELVRVSKELSELRLEAERRSTTEQKLLLYIDLIERELYHIKVSTLKTWPLSMTDVLSFAGAVVNFLPLLLIFSV